MTSKNVTARRLQRVAIVVAGLMMALYATVAGRQFTAGTFFLGLGAAALTYVAMQVFRTVQALLVEPDSDDTGIERVAGGRRRQELEREKQRLLKAIKEIEFDRQMGKLSEADFQESVGRYRARAMRVIRQLDPAFGEGGNEYRTLIEAELKVRLRSAQQAAARAAVPLTGSNDESSPAVAAAPVAGSAAAGSAVAGGSSAHAGASGSHVSVDGIGCAACGARNDPDATFCKKCGKALRPRCGACSTENDGDAAFCKKCGANLTPGGTGGEVAS